MYLEGGYQHLFVDGANLSTDEFALRVPDHSYGVLMAQTTLPLERRAGNAASS